MVFVEEKVTRLEAGVTALEAVEPDVTVQQPPPAAAAPPTEDEVEEEKE